MAENEPQEEQEMKQELKPEENQKLAFIEAEVAGQQALVAADRKPDALSMLMDPEKANQAFRVAEFLSKSTIIPKDFQRQPANVFIALHLAHRLKMDPIMAMQKMYVINGRPSFEAQFKIALVNSSGEFKTALKWKEVGQKGTDSWGMIAYATRKSGQVCEGPPVTMGMAKAEGWYDKSGSKWKTIPDLMLHYRSASWFANVHCPDITLGMPSRDELEDRTSTIEVEAVEKRPDPALEAPKVSQTDQILDMLGSAPPPAAEKKIHVQNRVGKGA